jgi:hypothetical protein
MVVGGDHHPSIRRSGKGREHVGADRDRLFDGSEPGAAEGVHDDPAGGKSAGRARRPPGALVGTERLDQLLHPIYVLLDGAIRRVVGVLDPDLPYPP